ncbi:MAG: YgaP-like transmembrane domain [Halobellus sp.]|uniref:YgaP-like transmembrane domain n=1 Tax=Halobellus sp. TaxID=1979212 RepID=UPI0035D4F053
MSSDKNVGGRDRLLRAVLAMVLTVVSVRSMQKNSVTTGLLAGLGALGLGFNAVTCVCGMNRALGIDTTKDQ